MRRVDVQSIRNAVAELCLRANTNLRRDVYRALQAALSREKNLRDRQILQALLENATCARRLKLAICQDTGLPHVFAHLGQGLAIVGGSFLQAINQGIALGYRRYGLRNSIIRHPLERKTKPGFSPGVVHIELVKGRGLELAILPKGFGCENKSAVKMFKPTADLAVIKDFVLDTVRRAGPDACPPFIVGVGIGGGLEQAAYLAKKALLTPLNKRNRVRRLASLERDLLAKMNQLKIGPAGLGGRTTALAVKILAHPTHIAGLPVAVNISCHALRSASKRL